ncbi:hypothetical protein F5Y17DRAFT_454700 [Xylariaceae sp. FL0594]|nr:hypothetical protein F5Y17DRAFT_454700 [Xylariaceae sp. FL0594]
MWRPAEAPFVALLVLFHTVLTGGEILSDVEVPKPSLAVSTISSTLISTVTHSGTIYVLAPQATFSPFGPEHIMNKRNPLSFHVDGQVEATVVIAPAPVSAAWTTFIEPQDAIPSGYGGSSVPGTSSGPYPTNGVGTSPAGSPGGNAGNGPAGNPSGGNGSGSGPGDTGGAPAGNTPGPESGNSPGGNTGGSPVGGNPGSNNNPNSPNNGSGSGPESSGTNPSSSGGTGPGADSGNIPSGNSSDNGTGAGGQPSLPSGAYGQQPPSPSSQETAGPVGQQPPIPAATQTASSLGQQTTNPASWGLPTPTGEGSPSPTGGQSPSGQPTPVALTTIVSALGTVVETVTVTLQSAPGNVPLATPSSSSPGAWSPFSAPNGQPQPITPGTFPSTTCDSSIPTDVISGSAAAPWGVMSAANTPPTTEYDSWLGYFNLHHRYIHRRYIDFRYSSKLVH